ncbi:hypothetical protein [Peijinzhouia sedimentorum]
MRFTGLIFILITLCISSCNRPTASQKLERVAEELNKQLYPEVVELENDPVLSNGLVLPPVFIKQMGEYSRTEVNNPKEITMAGEMYTSYSCLYKSEKGKSFVFRLSDMNQTDVLLDNRKRRVENIIASDTDELKTVVLPFDTKSISGNYQFHKKEKSSIVSIFAYNRYFVEIESVDEVSENDVLSFIVHLSFDALKN